MNLRLKNASDSTCYVFSEYYDVHKTIMLPDVLHNVDNLHEFTSHHKVSVNKQGQKNSVGNKPRRRMLLPKFMENHRCLILHNHSVQCEYKTHLV